MSACQAFDGLGVCGGDPIDGVFEVVPLVGVNNALGSEFVFEGVS